MIKVLYMEWYLLRNQHSRVVWRLYWRDLWGIDGSAWGAETHLFGPRFFVALVCYLGRMAHQVVLWARPTGVLLKLLQSQLCDSSLDTVFHCIDESSWVRRINVALVLVMNLYLTICLSTQVPNILQRCAFQPQSYHDDTAWASR